jgi:hypothetical protein
MKRHMPPGLQKGVDYKGMKHSMHRKDGNEGEYNEESKSVDYEEQERESGGWKDLGQSYAPVEIDKDKKHYPSLCLDAGKFPSLGKAEVGSTVTLSFKAKIVGASQRDDEKKIDLELREAALEE